MESIQILETIKTVSVIAHYADFEGGVEKWQQSYFQLLSWKNTFSVAFDIDVFESRKNGVFVRVVLHNKDSAERTVDYMAGLGYRNIKTYDVNVGVYELPDDLDYIFE